jgi:hypothetical protein
MLVSDVDLVPSWDNSLPEERSDFAFKARHITNYIRRAIRTRRIASDRFRRVVIECHAAELPPGTVNSEGVLCLPIPYVEGHYRQLSGLALSEYFCALIEQAYEHLSSFSPELVALMIECITALRSSGYENHWVLHKTRSPDRQVGFALQARLTSSAFEAWVVASPKGQPPSETLAFRDLPDELCFSHKVKSIRIDGSCIDVLDAKGRTVAAVEHIRANNSFKPTPLRGAA